MTSKKKNHHCRRAECVPQQGGRQLRDKILLRSSCKLGSSSSSSSSSSSPSPSGTYRGSGLSSFLLSSMVDCGVLLDFHHNSTVLLTAIGASSYVGVDDGLTLTVALNIGFVGAHCGLLV
ncbi:hypothetical protein PVK06_010385 [Gossypium arboreum]|uniref:Uncharacterized protein n=1 Tax=Gossypium arboreum TaxID=29729 RepID=A0ABR0Q6P7_GOSAR|nr:hypothetical protein PVK06_010385 [Gossypium arboreum]